MIPIIFIYLFAMFLLPIISLFVLFGVFNITEEISLQVYTNLISYLFLAIVSLSLFGRHLLADFKQIKSLGAFLKGIFLGWGLLLIALVASNALLSFITDVPDSSENQQVIETTLLAYPFLMAITTVLLAPLIEEIIFRLVLMEKTLFHPWINILFSSFLFALIHVVQAGDFIFIIPYMAMGIPLGYSYYKTRNICYPIGIHILQNLFSTLMIIIIS